MLFVSTGQNNLYSNSVRVLEIMKVIFSSIIENLLAIYINILRARSTINCKERDVSFVIMICDGKNTQPS